MTTFEDQFQKIQKTIDSDLSEESSGSTPHPESSWNNRFAFVCASIFVGVLMYAAKPSFILEHDPVSGRASMTHKVDVKKFLLWFIIINVILFIVYCNC